MSMSKNKQRELQAKNLRWLERRNNIPVVHYCGLCGSSVCRINEHQWKHPDGACRYRSRILSDYPFNELCYLDRGASETKRRLKKRQHRRTAFYSKTDTWYSHSLKMFAYVQSNAKRRTRCSCSKESL